MKKENTIHSLQYLRAISALLVTVSHSMAWYSRHISDLGEDRIALASLLGRLGVETFFVISGFIMYYGYLLNPNIQPYEFLKRRFIRIYPTYWFVSMLVLPVFLLKEEWVNSSVPVGTTLFHSFTLLPHASVPMLAVGWTLEYELFFYLLFALLLFVRPFLLGGISVLFMGLVIWGMHISYDQHQNPILYLLTDHLLGFFVVGMVLCWVYWNIRHLLIQSDLRIFIVAVSLSLASVCSYFGLDLVNQYNNTQNWYWYLLILLSVATIVFSALLLEPLAQPVNYIGQLFHHLGDASYSTYLIHVPVLVAIYRTMEFLEIGQYLNTVFVIGSVVLVCLIAGSVNYLIIEKRLIAKFQNNS